MAKKLVQFALDTSFSFGSPSIGADDSTSSEANNNNSATLQYVNSQLISHGYAHHPGISLEGINKEEGEKVVKCFLAMLGQRVDDMSRTEDLATKMRTLSYDHDRLMSMYRTEAEKSANAEKEMNVHKSRLASTARSLASATSAHKTTTAELQRSRTALQGLRATHQAELKKLEKDKEKLLEKVSKLSEYQYTTKISGVRYANAGILSESVKQVQIKSDAASKGFLEISLEESEKSRKQLIEENARLQGLVTRVANGVQNVAYEARCATVDLGLVKDDSVVAALEEPSLISAMSLFPLEQPDAASDKLTVLLSELKRFVGQLCDPDVRIGGSFAASMKKSRPAAATAAPDAMEPEESAQQQREVRRLQNVIGTLQQELEEAQSQASTYAAQAQDLLDQFSSVQESVKAAHAKEIERRTYAEAEELDSRAAELDAQARELEANQSKFTDSALKLSKERVAFESEKLKFLEEKRAWQVKAMLGDTDDPLLAHEGVGAPTAPPQPVASSSKHGLNKIFHPSSTASSSKRKLASVEEADDVLGHLPPPSPQVDAIMDEDHVMDMDRPEPAPEPRRSPRKVVQKATATNTLKRTRKASTSPMPSGGPAKKARLTQTRKASGSGASATAGPSSDAAAAKSKAKAKGKEPVREIRRVGTAKGKERAKPKITPSFDTEVIPKSPLPTSGAAPSLPAFVLPPPSPAARIPQMHIPSTADEDSPMKDPDNPFDLSNAKPTQPTNSRGPKRPQPTASSSSAPPPVAVPAPAPPAPSIPLLPQTPSRRIFPIGKPRAPHMVHAYSPVKPSPLSRILMLANSPDSPDENRKMDELDPLQELSEPDDDMEMPPSPTPARPNTRRMSLAEVGLESDEDEEMEMEEMEEVESIVRDKGKGKARAEPNPKPPMRTRAAAAHDRGKARSRPIEPLRIQKENVRKSPRTRARARTKAVPESTVQRSSAGARAVGGGTTKTRASTAKTARPDSGGRVATRSTTGPVPPLKLGDLEKNGAPAVKTKSGPRRVPIDSAEAAPVIPAWKG